MIYKMSTGKQGKPSWCKLATKLTYFVGVAIRITEFASQLTLPDGQQNGNFNAVKSACEAVMSLVWGTICLKCGRQITKTLNKGSQSGESKEVVQIRRYIEISKARNESE